MQSFQSVALCMDSCEEQEYTHCRSFIRAYVCPHNLWLVDSRESKTSRSILTSLSRNMMALFQKSFLVLCASLRLRPFCGFVPHTHGSELHDLHQEDNTPRSGKSGRLFAPLNISRGTTTVTSDSPSTRQIQNAIRIVTNNLYGHSSESNHYLPPFASSLIMHVQRMPKAHPAKRCGLFSRISQISGDTHSNRHHITVYQIRTYLCFTRHHAQSDRSTSLHSTLSNCNTNAIILHPLGNSVSWERSWSSSRAKELHPAHFPWNSISSKLTI